jgi:DNA ligase-1
MLAGTVKDEASIPFPILASPKLDGIRAIVKDEALLSRKLLEIPNRHVFGQLSRKEFHGLDGELIVGSSTAANSYTATMSGVMSEGGAPLVTFWVFDRWDLSSVYTYRRDRLPSRMELDGVVIKRLKHELINSLEELQIYEQHVLSRGYEGVMLRDPQGRYKFGRSTAREFALMKLKRFEDSEAEIIGIVEQKHNANEATINALGRMKRSSHKANKIPKGTTGALECRDLKTRVTFEIGTGMDDAIRAKFWEDPPIGRIAKYKFQPTGVKNKPRFPVFLGLRDPRDL